jgi:1A family penicillin-binding protein
MGRKNKKKSVTDGQKKSSVILWPIHMVFLFLALTGEFILTPIKFFFSFIIVGSRDCIRDIPILSPFKIQKKRIAKKHQSSAKNRRNGLSFARFTIFSRFNTLTTGRLRTNTLPDALLMIQRVTLAINKHLGVRKGWRNTRTFLAQINTAIMQLIHRYFIFMHQIPLRIHAFKPRNVLPRQPLLLHSSQKKNRTKPMRNLHPRRGVFFLWFTSGIVVSVCFLIVPFEFYRVVSVLPNPKLLAARDVPVTTKILDRNGILLYEIYSDENRTPVPLSEIPDIVKNSTISIEDRDFYKHQGFSIRGILRAADQTLLNDRLQGGSTITQQLIKSTLLTPEITIQRKLKEVILAFWAEQMYTKNQILEMYLNQIPYGGTAWGIESAAQTYFGKSVQNLTLSEAALLAGLPAAPSDYSPYGSNKEKAINRQKEVLSRMVENHYITKQEADEAAAQPLIFRQQTVPIRAPHFVFYVRDYLLKRYGPRLVERGGLRVITTLDSSLQDQVQTIVKNQIATLTPLHVGNGAALVTNPKTGDILAMVGSKNYFDIASDGNVNVTTALRQPGSSIKVVTYAAALEHGFTAASILQDSPVSYPLAGQAPYTPVNYDGRFHGPVPLRYALGNSFNIPAVKTLNTVGIPTMQDKAKLMGIDTWNQPERYGLSLTLGGAEVTMVDMAEVYGTLANQGKHMDLFPILSITDYAGNSIEQGNPASPIQAVSSGVSWILSNILSDNAARVMEFGPSSNLVIPGKTVSVKTGTTNEKRDNWTIGYTPSYVVTVWVGNNDNSPMNQQLASGITGAAPIWQEIMKLLLKDKPDEIQSKPDDIISVPCYYGKNEYFIKGTEPQGGRCQGLPLTTPQPTQQTMITPVSRIQDKDLASEQDRREPGKKKR